MVLTWITLKTEPWQRWAPLLRGHPLVLSFATVGEIRVLPLIRGWGDEKTESLELALRGYSVIEGSDWVTRQFARVRARFRDRVRDNDQWVVATALAVEPSLPIATGDMKAYPLMAAEFGLTLIYPDQEAAP